MVPSRAIIGRTPPRKPQRAPLRDPTQPRPHEIRQAHMGGLQLDEIKTVPPWVSFFSLEAWHALLVAIQDDLQRRHFAARYAGDHFSVALPDGRLARLAIVNLAERCRDVPIEDFIEAVLSQRTLYDD